MRKASRILFLVGAIVAIVAAVGYLIAGLVLVIVPNVDAFIEAASKEMTAQELEAVQAAMIINGVFFLLGVPFCGLSSFFAFKAHFQERPSKALNVLNIVFGALSIEVNLVGAIFALIADGQEDRRAASEQKE